MVTPPESGAYTIPNVLGPPLVGGIGAGLLQGMLLAQTVAFFFESTDGLLLKSTVAFINFVALSVSNHPCLSLRLFHIYRLQTILLGCHWWRLMVNVQ